MAAQENGSEQQLESGKDVFFHPFNFFLERIMPDALEEHGRKVSIDGKTITNLRFADDIDALAEEELKQKTHLKVSTRPAHGIKWR